MGTAAHAHVDERAPARADARRDLAWLAVLYLSAVLLYLALGRLRELPVLNPDEFIYGHLAQGLADGTGFDWRGEPTRLYALLYVVLITPAWLIESATSALTIAKAIGAASLCLVCVPVVLLTRELLSSRLAMLAGALSLAGTWMTTSSMLLTENASLPLVTAALCSTVMALRAPGSRWIWYALGFALLGACARVQVAVVIPVVLLALGLDVARSGSDWRARGAEQRSALISAGALTVILLALALVASSVVTGSIYDETTRFSVFSPGILAATLRQLIVLVAMAGFVPLALIVPLAAMRSSWRDASSGPLLAVLVPAAGVFAAQAGWFMHGLGYGWAIQRYVEYSVPLALIATLVAASRARALPSWSWVVPLLAAPVVLLGGRLVWLDELGAFAPGQAARAVGLSPWVGGAVAMATAGSLALWIGRRLGGRGQPDRAALVVGTLLLMVLVAQSAVAWAWPVDQDRTWRAGFPSDLTWLDRAARGPVARLVVTSSHPRWPTVEFFNRDVDRVYALASADTNRVLGRVCTWTIGPTGEAVFDPACGPTPTRFYLDDPAARLSFVGQRVLAQTKGTGRVISVPGPPSVPHVNALLVLPCDDRTLLDRRGRALGYGERVCRPVMSGYFWLQAPGLLTLRVRGGERPHQVSSGRRMWRLPSGSVTTIRLPLPAGSSQVELRFDSLELPLGYPDVVSARLVTAGHSATLL